ncbi:MAG: hypothetical protein JKY45_07225 [Emcibacter sp.]|nr:hypothetical protein [Emcibacter sp.]
MEQKQSLINHFAQSLTGAWELVKLNPRAMDYFDKSADGFWKSFWAIALVAPVFFLGLNISYDAAVAQGHQISLTAHVVEFLFRLPLIALVMIFFTRFLRIDAHYSDMIIAFNWLWVIANYILLPLSMLISMNILPIEVATLGVVAIAIYLELYVTWFLYKVSLKVSGWLAFGVMVFKALFTLSVMQVIIRVF